MSEEKSPYVDDDRCGRCFSPVRREERWEGGWLYVTLSCTVCGFKKVVTFSPGELAEREKRRRKSGSTTN